VLWASAEVSADHRSASSEIPRTANSRFSNVIMLSKTKVLFRKPILFAIYTSTFGARGSVVLKAVCYKPGSSPDEVNF
jgi:hypothetical protein